MSVRIFSETEIDAMCQRFGFDRAALRVALIKVGPSALLKELRQQWSAEHPFSGFCYRVCEAIYRSGRVPDGFKPMRRKDGLGSHWFFQNESTSEILDPTADQFTRTGAPRGGYDYDGAESKRFMPQESIGAKAVARAMGWTYVAKKAK